jgi:hypothetical protein
MLDGGCRDVSAAATASRTTITYSGATKKSLEPVLEPIQKAFYEIYAAFVSTFREASEKLRRGDRNAPLPLGSFPPDLPFVAG